MRLELNFEMCELGTTQLSFPLFPLSEFMIVMSMYFLH